MSLINGFPSGGGAKVNGSLVPGVVIDGAIINKGDFVSKKDASMHTFYNDYTAYSQSEIIPIKLDDGRYALFYPDANMRLRCFVFRRTGESPVMTQLSTTMVVRPCVKKLRDGRIVVMYGDAGNSNRLACGVININQSGTATLTASIIGAYANAGATWRYGNFIELSDGRLFAAHSHNYNEPEVYYCPKTSLITLNGDIPSLQSTATFSGITSMLKNPGLIEMTGNTVLVACQSNGGNSRNLNALLVTISGTAMSYSHLGFGGSTCDDDCKVFKLSDTVGIIFNHYSYLYGRIITINGTSLTVKEYQLTSTIAGGGCACEKIGDQTYRIVSPGGPLQQVIVQVDNNIPKVTNLRATTLGVDAVYYTYSNLASCLTDAGMLVGYKTSSPYNTRAVFLEPLLSTYNGSLEIAGVAKTGGKTLELIQFYSPQI